MYFPCDKPLVPKDYPRYPSVTKWKYYQILGKHNNRVVINFIDKVAYEEQYKSVQKIVLYGFVYNIAKTTKVGLIGAIDAYNIQLLVY